MSKFDFIRNRFSVKLSLMAIQTDQDGPQRHGSEETLDVESSFHTEVSPHPILPKRLSVGDKVSVIALGSPSKAESIRVGTSLLQKRGLKVNLCGSIDSSDQLFHSACGVEERLSLFCRELLDSEVKAIFIATGGGYFYELLDHLNFELFRDYPKIIAGYSEATTLLVPITDMTGLVTYHGPMPGEGNLSNSKWSAQTVKDLNCLIDLLMGGNIPLALDGLLLKSLPMDCEPPEEIHGSLIGGNFSNLHSLYGTRWSPHLNERILFIEDIGEPLASVSRELWNLSQRGFFTGLRALICGRFTPPNEIPDFRARIEQRMFEVGRALNLPIFFSNSFGHNGENLVIPNGVNVALKQLDSIRYKIELIE